jgi:hypothetical protein
MICFFRLRPHRIGSKQRLRELRRYAGLSVSARWCRLIPTGPKRYVSVSSRRRRPIEGSPEGSRLIRHQHKL